MSCVDGSVNFNNIDVLLKAAEILEGNAHAECMNGNVASVESRVTVGAGNRHSQILQIIGSTASDLHYEQRLPDQASKFIHSAIMTENNDKSPQCNVSSVVKQNTNKAELCIITFSKCKLENHHCSTRLLQRAPSSTVNLQSTTDSLSQYSVIHGNRNDGGTIILPKLIINNSLTATADDRISELSEPDDIGIDSSSQDSVSSSNVNMMHSTARLPDNPVIPVARHGVNCSGSGNLSLTSDSQKSPSLFRLRTALLNPYSNSCINRDSYDNFHRSTEDNNRVSFERSHSTPSANRSLVISRVANHRVRPSETTECSSVNNKVPLIVHGDPSTTSPVSVDIVESNSSSHSRTQPLTSHRIGRPISADATSNTTLRRISSDTCCSEQNMFLHSSNTISQPPSPRPQTRRSSLPISPCRLPMKKRKLNWIQSDAISSTGSPSEQVLTNNSAGTTIAATPNIAPLNSSPHDTLHSTETTSFQCGMDSIGLKLVSPQVASRTRPHSHHSPNSSLLIRRPHSIPCDSIVSKSPVCETDPDVQAESRNQMFPITSSITLIDSSDNRVDQLKLRNVSNSEQNSDPAVVSLLPTTLFTFSTPMNKQSGVTVNTTSMITSISTITPGIHLQSLSSSTTLPNQVFSTKQPLLHTKLDATQLPDKGSLSDKPINTSISVSTRQVNDHSTANEYTSCNGSCAYTVSCTARNLQPVSLLQPLSATVRTYQHPRCVTDSVSTGFTSTAETVTMEPTVSSTSTADEGVISFSSPSTSQPPIVMMLNSCTTNSTDVHCPGSPKSPFFHGFNVGGTGKSFPLLLVSASSSANAAALAAAAAVATGAPPTSFVPVPVQVRTYLPRSTEAVGINGSNQTSSIPVCVSNDYLWNRPQQTGNHQRLILSLCTPSDQRDTSSKLCTTPAAPLLSNAVVDKAIPTASQTSRISLLVQSPTATVHPKA